MREISTMWWDGMRRIRNAGVSREMRETWQDCRCRTSAQIVCLNGFVDEDLQVIGSFEVQHLSGFCHSLLLAGNHVNTHAHITILRLVSIVKAAMTLLW